MAARGWAWSALRLGQALLLGAAGAAGCQAIAGIEDRHYEQPLEAGAGDAAMKKPASKACKDYCKDITDTCVDENAQYASEDACLDVCALIPEGGAEPDRFSIECRNMQVQSAMIGEKSDACFGAGPGGAKACGSDCESYCQLFTNACSDMFQTPARCADACQGLAKGTWTVIEAKGDTLACRLYHVSAAAGDPATHCQHARLAPPTTPCADDPMGVPDCNTYCNFLLATCNATTDDQGVDVSVYESMADCLATCRALPQGLNKDIDGDSVGCRHYHTYNAIGDWRSHCPHAGPAGDGHCGSNCEAYCHIAASSCESDFVAAYGSGTEAEAACEADCETFDGAAKDSGYTLATATGNNVQCRLKEAVGAFSKQSRCAGAFGKAAPCK